MKMAITVVGVLAGTHVLSLTLLVSNRLRSALDVAARLPLLHPHLSIVVRCTWRSGSKDWVPEEAELRCLLQKKK